MYLLTSLVCNVNGKIFTLSGFSASDEVEAGSPEKYFWRFFFPSLSLASASSWSQFHQYFTIIFCVDILSVKNYKAKPQLEKSFTKHLHTKKAIVKCWWNRHLVEDRRRKLFAAVAKRIGHLLLLLLLLLLSRWRRLGIVSLWCCCGGGFARIWRWVSGGRRVLEVAHGGRALLFHHTIGGQTATTAAHGIE